MKQLKILVALIAGLFSFTSANAGEMTVSGTMQATYQSEADDVTGNPLGLNTDLKFTGTTEVLNGTAVTWTLATDGTFAGDAGADHKLAFATPSFGTFSVGNSSDSANAVDDVTPTAFEEANGSGSGTYSNDFGSGMEGSMNVGYSNANIMGSGVGLSYSYYPKLDGKTNNEKGSSTGAVDSKSAQSANLKITGANVAGMSGTLLEGLVVTVGYEISDALVDLAQDKEGGTVALNYAYGPVKVGYQKKAYAPKGTTVASDTFFKDDIYGIAVAVNDSLALSYNVIESTRTNNNSAANTDQETTAINVAYTVGGLTIGFSDAKTDGAGYAAATEDNTRTLSLKTAF